MTLSIDRRRKAKVSGPAGGVLRRSSEPSPQQPGDMGSG